MKAIFKAVKNGMTVEVNGEIWVYPTVKEAMADIFNITHEAHSRKFILTLETQQLPGETTK